jgi:type IV secretion system protein VirB10
MKLKDKAVEAASEDRTHLNERVTGSSTPGQKLVGAAAALGAVVVIFGGLGYKYWYLPAHEAPVVAGATANKTDSTPPTSPKLNIPDAPYPAAAPLPPNNAMPPLPPGMGPTPQLAGNAPPPPPGAGQTDQAAATRKAQEEKEIRERKFGSDMGAMPGRTDSAMLPVTLPAQGGQPGSAGATIPASLIGGGGGGNASNDFSAKLIPTSTPKVSASYIPNASLTIIKGTPIRCTLDTAINSDTPGFTSCTVSKPVYSMDGTTVLVEAGSTVDGEIPKGPDRGKKRAAVLWGRIVTNDHVTISVNSPGTDTLGAAGLTGSIDNHYCERFCGAFLFSSFQDMLQAGVTALGSNSGSGNTNITLPQNTMSSGQSAAGEILTQGKDVQPTFSKNQGDEITITVARDLDFSTAYHLTENTQ